MSYWAERGMMRRAAVVVPRRQDGRWPPTGQARPSSYHTKISQSDGFQLPPLADCLMSMILISECSRNHRLISFSNASSLKVEIEKARDGPSGLFAQNSLTF